MPKKKKRATVAAGAENGNSVDPVERLKSLARKHPKVTESLELALELGIMAAEALKQIAVGIRQGTKIAARRRRAIATTTRPRRPAAEASKGR